MVAPSGFEPARSSAPIWPTPMPRNPIHNLSVCTRAHDSAANQIRSRYRPIAPLPAQTCAPPPDGFKKIPVVGSNGSADQRTDVAEFYHVNFVRGQDQRIASIKRKVTTRIPIFLTPFERSL